MGYPPDLDLRCILEDFILVAGDSLATAVAFFSFDGAMVECVVESIGLYNCRFASSFKIGCWYQGRQGQDKQTWPALLNIITREWSRILSSSVRTSGRYRRRGEGATARATVCLEGTHGDIG